MKRLTTYSRLRRSGETLLFTVPKITVDKHKLKGGVLYKLQLSEVIE